MKKDWLDKGRIRHLLRPRSFGRFVIVGVINTVMGFGCFPLLYLLFGAPPGYNPLLVTSWMICTSIAFVLHKFVTFKSGGRADHEGGKFLLLSLAILGINLGVMNVMEVYTRVHPVLVQEATTLVLTVGLMILNYFGMSRLIFTSTK